MRTKFFTLFAAFTLLFGAKAMAQTNGDVNEDGVVNEQDITAIIQIMQEAGGMKEQTKYYWYVGQTQPTADNYTTLEGIQQVTDYPTTFEYTNNSGKRGYAYVILHNSKTLTAVEKVSQATVNFTTDTSIPNYTIYKSTAGMAINGVMVITVNEKQTEDTKYYWYAGWTEPTAENIATLINKQYPSNTSQSAFANAGKTSTTTSGVTFDLLNSKLYDDVYLNASPTDRVKRNYYIVVPNGQGIYDILGTQLHLDSAFATQVGSFTNHKIYKSSATSISITSIIIK